MTDLSPPSARIDVWLWRARFFRTRALASRQVSARGVRVTRLGQTRRVTRPGSGVLTGDVVTFNLGSDIKSVEIVALGDRRGPAPEARLLYREIGNQDA